MPTQPESNELQPGADRFWGQFSQSTAGRTGDPESEAGEDTSGAGSGSQAGSGPDSHCLEWCPICRSAELLRTAVSPELRQQAESIQHEAIGVLKAFLDAYTEGGGPGHATPNQTPEEAGNGQPEEPPESRVTDIPLD